MSGTLARAWCDGGHEVKVITTSEGDEEIDGVRILRNPSAAAVWKTTRWSDVCFHNNISMKWAWAPRIARRPWVVTHQTWLTKADGKIGWQERVKRWSLRGARSIAISAAVAAHLPGPSTIIPNAYNDGVFSLPPDGYVRDQDLVFVGRFVSDKGGDLLISAMRKLADQNVTPRLTMIGQGPEKERWCRLANEAGLSEQVRWVGPLQGHALASELRRHRIMVVPSRWAEPFGIVALEGAACGCLVVGSRNGGLIDAIGSCGETFFNGDVGEFATTLMRAWRGEIKCDPSRVLEHLRIHQAGGIAARYLRVFEEELT